MAATFKASHSKRWVHTLISTSCICVFPLDHNNFMIMIMIIMSLMGTKPYKQDQNKTPLYLAVKVPFRVALEELSKNYIFSIRFIYSIHQIWSLEWSLLGVKKRLGTQRPSLLTLGDRCEDQTATEDTAGDAIRGNGGLTEW